MVEVMPGFVHEIILRPNPEFKTPFDALQSFLHTNCLVSLPDGVVVYPDASICAFATHRPVLSIVVAVSIYAVIFGRQLMHAKRET
jgi:hypothetical protein